MHKPLRREGTSTRLRTPAQPLCENQTWEMDLYRFSCPLSSGQEYESEDMSQRIKFV
jgi:hypothetical protein